MQLSIDGLVISLVSLLTDSTLPILQQPQAGPHHLAGVLVSSASDLLPNKRVHFGG